jgi:hypothetical protein
VNTNMRPANLWLMDQQSLVNVNFYSNISSIKVVFVHFLFFFICE